MKNKSIFPMIVFILSLINILVPIVSYIVIIISGSPVLFPSHFVFAGIVLLFTVPGAFILAIVSLVKINKEKLDGKGFVIFNLVLASVVFFFCISAFVFVLWALANHPFL